MEAVKIAVIGAGPSGLSAIKTFREEGFDVTCFEKKRGAGGVWTDGADSRYTAALRRTVAANNKLSFSMSDFPISKDCPLCPTAVDLESHWRAYANHYDLDRSIQYGTTITRIERDDEQNKWKLHVKSPSGDTVVPFDKVLVANGLMSEPITPSCSGIEKFSGTTMHSQAFKYSKEELQQFKGKRVLLVGLGNTSCDISIELTGCASKIYIAHRRGRKVASRYRDDGVPVDLPLSWGLFQTKYVMEHVVPSLAWSAVDSAMTSAMISSAARGERGASASEKKKTAEKRLREEWHLIPTPSMKQVNPVSSESLYDALRGGDVALVSGFKAFEGDKSVSLDDGTNLEADVVIFCTGYEADWSLFPDLPMNGSCGVPLSTASGAGKTASPGAPTPPRLPRLYQNIFPTSWASSLAFSNYSHPQESNPAAQELVSMAVAQIWAADAASTLAPEARETAPAGYRPPARLPPADEMERAIDGWQAWWRANWEVDHGMLQSAIPGYGWFRFLHEAAGTGMYDNLGHLFAFHKGWGLWWRDRELYTWIAQGPMTNMAFRVFDTNPLGIPGCGRRVNKNARQALKDIYEQAEEIKRRAKARTLNAA